MEENPAPSEYQGATDEEYEKQQAEKIAAMVKRNNRPAWWKVIQANDLYEKMYTLLPEDHPAYDGDNKPWEAFLLHWCMSILTGSITCGIPEDLLAYARLHLESDHPVWGYLEL